MLTEDALRHAITRYNKGSGVNSTSIHKFRHTFARKYLLDCGGNAFTLQKLMGHSTLNMTKHYCRVFDSDVGKDYDLHSPLAQFQKAKNGEIRTVGSRRPQWLMELLQFMDAAEK